ncbi:MAG TPA: serine/threonine protein kinase, partial [Trebonia sp.]
SLQPGTGLLLDLGKKMTVTKVTLDLAAGSADVIIRVGNSQVPGTFTGIADGTGVGGTTSLQAARAASGRYVEVWFTSLPQDAAGTYQESVYGVQVTGRP